MGVLMSDASQYIFRGAEQSDMPWLLGLYGKFYPLVGSGVPPSSVAFSEFLSVAMSTHAVDIIIAETGGKRIGAIGLSLIPSVFNTGHKVASELFFWVDEGHRSGGVGGELMDHAEDMARRAGATVIHMVALDRSMPKQVSRLYRARGYLPIEHLFEKEL